MTTPLMYSYFGLPVTQGPKVAGNSIDWDTIAFSTPVTFMGIPEVKVNVRTDSETFQVNAFLWDVDPSGRASMLLHEAYTKFEATPGSVYPVDIRMNLLAQKLGAGHKLRLTLSTSDPAFALSVLQPFTLEVLSGQDGPISLTLPVMGGQRSAQ
jgi:predicted acyl esterase